LFFLNQAMIFNEDTFSYSDPLAFQASAPKLTLLAIYGFDGRFMQPEQ